MPPATSALSASDRVGQRLFSFEDTQPSTQIYGPGNVHIVHPMRFLTLFPSVA